MIWIASRLLRLRPGGGTEGEPTMDLRLHTLTQALKRARQRVDYCRRELDRFDREADESDPRTERQRRKLEGDLRLAEQDAGWAEIALADTTSPAEVAHLSQETDECRQGA